MQEMWVQYLGQEDPPPEKEMATHISILAWKIPWTEEPGRLYPWCRKESDPTEQLNNNQVAPTGKLPAVFPANALGSRPGDRQALV